MKRNILILFILLSTMVYSYDMRIEITESMLNNLLKTIGEVNGKSSFKILNQKVKYKWKIDSARIKIINGTAKIDSKIIIKTNLDKTKTKLLAELKVNYDDMKGVLEISIINAKISKIEMFGGEIKIENVDISKYYQPTYEIKVNKPKEEVIEIKLEENKSRKIRVVPEKGKISFIENAIAVDFDLRYENID